ncbi:MAG TPA: hypothetical protein VMA71_08440 [Alloacidobacterium sp.]|nr:hypothetical protein [Alloacidobacterium sp.]
MTTTNVTPTNPEHNKNLVPKNPDLKGVLRSYNQWLTNKYLREETKATLRDIMNDPTVRFQSSTFQQRVDITKGCVIATYYRKISNGEFAAIENETKPFKKAFEYTQTDNYRYWVSSSLAKCKKFGNENSTDSGGVIILMEFTIDLRKPTDFKVKAHQEQGVQNTPEFIAIHREGFAELQPISKQTQVDEIIDNNLDHNLGFTIKHIDLLKNNLNKWERVPN